ncbi:MAG: antibiotic biosynthesis monooxygenase [Chloroflexota bacterium]|nr:antibiotic biosynthesis monooxygenase [Chloroflexota bacterium]
MAYARIGMYTVKPGTLDAILTKAEAELVPQTRQQPGFRRYFSVRTGEDSLVSVTIWEDKEQAEQAAERLSGWVRAEMGPSLVKVENQVGELTVSSVPSGEIHGYARIAVWQFKPGAADALTERVKAEMLPLMEGEPGFIGYGVARTGELSGVSVTAFASQEQSQAAAEKIAVWVREHAAASIASVERSEGAIVWGVRAG